MRLLPKTVSILVVTIAFSLVITPSKADAHGIGGIGPSKTNAEVISIVPSSSTFKAESIENGNRFKVTRTGPNDIVILGVDDEPYLQLTSEGVFVNRKSATRLINQSASTTKSVETLRKEFEATSSDPNEKPSWEKVSSKNSYAFHDHRTHYMGSVPKGVTELGASQVKIRVVNTIHVVTLKFKAKSSSFPNLFLIIMLLTMAVIGAGSFFLRDGFLKIAKRKTLIVSLALIGILESVHIYGYAKFSQQSTFSVLSSSLYGLILLALILFSFQRVTFRSRESNWEAALIKHAPLLCATGFVGLSAGALLEYRILVDPYLPTVLPDWFSRTSIITVGIISVAIFSLGIAKIKQPENNEVQSTTKTS